jgi:UDP-N-acetylmuramate: L-alanyl-gamma-D-glutamyl-meso-diaminopimelate ligase
MHIHILGISGTFMGSLAALAKESGFEVTGSDLQ